MKTYKFSRETAVEKGYRKDVKINKERFKRPFLTIKKNLTQEEKEQYEKFKEIAMNKKPEVDISYLDIITTPFNGIGKEELKIKKDSKKFITLNELKTLDNFKDRTLYVYVEGQYKTNYELRSILRSDMNEIVEINLGEFYDIAGRIVYINLDKNNGEYKIKKIVYKS